MSEGASERVPEGVMEFVTMLLVALWRNQTDTGLHAGDHDLRVPEPLLGRWADVAQQQSRQRQL